VTALGVLNKWKKQVKIFIKGDVYCLKEVIDEELEKFCFLQADNWYHHQLISGDMLMSVSLMVC